jgi:hypothetical protein
MINIKRIENSLPDGVFGRAAIMRAAKMEDPEFRDTLLRNFIEKLKKSGSIIHIGRDQYVKDTGRSKKIYAGIYSSEGKSLARRMSKRFPLVDYRIWEFSWLNEFMNHQIAHNRIFLEVEKVGCDFVFDDLIGKYQGNILLRPKPEDVFRYGRDGIIIVDNLISGAPEGDPDQHNLSLEKLIVDLFANKVLMSMVSQGDYPEAISEMFENYQINQSMLLRYASRRNRADIILKFIKENTNVELAAGG